MMLMINSFNFLKLLRAMAPRSEYGQKGTKKSRCFLFKKKVATVRGGKNHRSTKSSTAAITKRQTSTVECPLIINAFILLEFYHVSDFFFENIIHHLLYNSNSYQRSTFFFPSLCFHFFLAPSDRRSIHWNTKLSRFNTGSSVAPSSTIVPTCAREWEREKSLRN